LFGFFEYGSLTRSAFWYFRL